MSTSSSSLARVSLLLLPVLGICNLAKAELTIADSLRVQQNAYIAGDVDLGGTVFMGSLPQNPEMEGFRVEVQQSSWQQSWTNWVNGYTSYQTVVQEVYGEIPLMTYNQTWGDVQVGTNYYPEVYDGDGNVVSAAYTEPRFEYQMVSSSYTNTGSYWGVTGTQEVQAETWYEGYYETVYGDTVFDAPRILMTSSRSDASWAWRNPSSSGVPGETKDLMVLSEGGISFPATAESQSYATLGQHQLRFESDYVSTGSSYQRQNVTVSQENIHAISEQSQWGFPTNSVALYNRQQATSNLQPNALELRRTETTQLRAGGSQGETSVTQIAAKSAHFGGVVTVEGNINSKGVIRVLPAGDLSMGEFHRGHKPDGTFDNGGN